MIDNRIIFLIAGIVIALLICYYLHREVRSTRIRVSDMERVIGVHNNAIETLQAPPPTEDLPDPEEVPVKEE